MFKIQKLKLLLGLILVFSAVGFGFGSSRATALTYSDSDRKLMAKDCSEKLDIPVNTKDAGDRLVLGACEEGYILGIEHPNDNSACDSAYKGHPNALHACKVTGFNLGKANSHHIKGKDSGGGGKGPTCVGSECSPTPTGAGHNCDSNHCDLISLYINPFIRVLSIIVGLVVAASLVLGGVQYSASSGDPQKISAAKSRISNTLMAFLAYAFLFAFLNFLIPGGLFH